MDLLYESDALDGASRLAIDPDGRFVVRTSIPQRADELVRIDLAEGTTELFSLGVSAGSMDLRILVDVPLQAGDADQDFDFDQLDLVRVQLAGDYLTGNPATWGDGDWDGAPGGYRGNPPAGDGVFDQLDIVASLQAGTYLTGPYAAWTDAFSHIQPASIAAVPEPATVLLLCAGVCMLAVMRHRLRP